MKKTSLFLVCSAILISTACSPQQDNAAATQKDFIESCRAQPGADEQTCHCIYSQLEEKYGEKNLHDKMAQTRKQGFVDASVQKQINQAALSCKGLSE